MDPTAIGPDPADGWDRYVENQMELQARVQFTAEMRALYAVMNRTESAHQEYVNASGEANTAFCLFANTYGFNAALQARDEAVNEES